jgi:hypothetical protein
VPRARPTGVFTRARLTPAPMTSTYEEHPMKRTVFWSLVVINVVLLAALVAPYIKSNSAMAQRAGGGRRPELMMIPASPVGGGNSDIVYLVDTQNRQLGAIALNSRGNGLDSLAPQDLNRVFEDREVGAGPGGAKGGRNNEKKGNR